MKISYADLVYESLDDINYRLKKFNLSPLRPDFHVEPEGSISCFYEEELGFSLIDFTKLPTGTFKYIDSSIGCEWYLQNNNGEKIVVPSSGNTARAVCYWASHNGVEVEAIVTKDSWYKIESELKSSKIHFTQFHGNLDEARKYAKELAKNENYFYFAPTELKIATYAILQTIIKKYEQETGTKICLYSQAVSSGIGPVSVLFNSFDIKLLLIQPDDLAPIVDAIEDNSPRVVDNDVKTINSLFEPTLGTKIPSTYENYLYPAGKGRIFGEKVSPEEIKNSWSKIRKIFLKHGIMGDNIDSNFGLEKSGIIAVTGTLKHKRQGNGVICAITGRGGTGSEYPVEPDKIVQM